MKKTIFTGAGVAIVTPMNADGSINFDKLGELIDFNIDNRHRRYHNLRNNRRKCYHDG